MRLERVEIVGFKSFCDKQELDFKGGGVTGIVGPNGCGKSNISDAISWVLGEQSAKSLRGTSMEDVIFNGSQTRQPLAMAEVNLKVSGLNGHSIDATGEVMVTRRLYRNGDSEYQMNGQICRLRDIHELFMDTGLGSKAYSIIEQGKIGQILSTKPADRRALIEEAAGITKYRARRRQTQLKLEAAQQNLLRVNDIIHEVEKQLESLKRQAGKARRYRGLREEMLGIERVRFGRRFIDLADQRSLLADRQSQEVQRETAAGVALEAEEARMEARRTALYEEEGRLEHARGRLNEQTLAVDRHQGRSGYCKEQIAEAEARTAEAQRETEELTARVGPLASHVAERQAEDARLAEERRQAEAESQAAEAAHQEAAASQARLESDQEAARESQVAILGRLATLQNAQASVTGNAERAAADLLKLAAEGEELQRERARVDDLRSAAQRREVQAESLVVGLVRDRDVAATRGTEARGRAEALAAEADSLESERDSLTGRLASLKELVDSHAAFDDGVRALLARPAGLEVLGVVADAVEADSAHERAVEAFLGDRLQTILVPSAASALRGIRYLETSEAGRATFLPVAPAAPLGEVRQLRQIAASEGKVRGLVSDLYRVTGPHADAIRASLPDGILVESLDDAFALAARHGAIPCATLQGETVRGPLVEGGRSVKGLLAPRREIREITSRLPEIEARVLALRQTEREESARAEAAAAETRELEERIHAAEKELVAVRHDLAAADEEWSRLDRKAAVLDTERGQAEEERGAAAVRLAEIEHAIGSAEAERAATGERLAVLSAEVAQARAASETAQGRTAESRSRLAALRERTAAVEAECRRLSDDQRELVERISAARGRSDEGARRREELAAELAESERLLALALAERDRSGGEAALVEDRVRDLRNELDSRDQALKERRREREMLRDALSDLEVQTARVESELDHLARDCHQTVGRTAAEAAESLSDEEKTRDPAELEVQIQELRDRVDRMGPVNVLAVEQAQELDERATFLTSQRQDLLDSIAEMEQAIRKIDRTSKERFAEAFRVINEHFGTVFRQLFGGGTAGLSLIDDDDILESGIDVMAQPPGKRLQNVMLLSGGEKALTAISLLFAIFQYKPSPFCILDEVDAPLDDANIGRFVRMLDGLKEQTQFVLITHSRKTMEIADQLYGVTMEEPGVSKLVSVRFR